MNDSEILIVSKFIHDDYEIDHFKFSGELLVLKIPCKQIIFVHANANRLSWLRRNARQKFDDKSQRLT